MTKSFRRWSLALAALVAFWGLSAAPAQAQTKNVEFSWYCDQDQCWFDATGTTTSNLSFLHWDFDDGTYGGPTGSMTIFHDYDLASTGYYYFDVTLTAVYFSDPNSPYEVTCEVLAIWSPVGGNPPRSGSCSN